MPSDPRTPAGCLVVQGALACGDAAGSVRTEIAARRAAAKVALRRRLQRAKREGDLPPNADPAQLSHYVMTVLHGMAVQGADGASPAQLRRVAHIALRAWPKSVSLERFTFADAKRDFIKQTQTVTWLANACRFFARCR